MPRTLLRANSNNRRQSHSPSFRWKKFWIRASRVKRKIYGIGLSYKKVRFYVVLDKHWCKHAIFFFIFQIRPSWIINTKKVYKNYFKGYDYYVEHKFKSKNAVKYLRKLCINRLQIMKISTSVKLRISIFIFVWLIEMRNCKDIHSIYIKIFFFLHTQLAVWGVWICKQSFAINIYDCVVISFWVFIIFRSS